MPLSVTMYTIVGGVDRVVGSQVLATRPRQVAQRTVYFGRGDHTLAEAARSAPALSTDDGAVSKVQGRIDYEDGAVIVTNLSSVRTLAVRGWGARPVSIGKHESRSVGHGRAVVDILDASSYLVIGPDEPLESGWQRDLVSGADTPGLVDQARARLRPVVLCVCRHQDVDVCGALGHDRFERDLLVSLAGGLPFSSWPQGRDASEGSRKSIAALLGIEPYQLSRFAKAFEERLGEATALPDQDEADLFCWLVEREIFSFDEVADLVARVS